MSSEEKGEPNLAKYYNVSDEFGLDDFSDITLKTISIGFLLLGMIAFMVNALMVFLFMRQDWAVIWPRTSAAQIGVIFMCFGGALYLVDRLLERKFKEK